MSRFADNVNDYMFSNKIKNSFLQLRTGINEERLLRILHDDTYKITEEEISIISAALGYDCEYFMKKDFEVETDNVDCMGPVLHNAEAISHSQKMAVRRLIKFAEGIDYILSAKNAFFEGII